MHERTPLGRFANETRARTDALRRVRESVLAEAGPESVRDLLQALPEASPTAITRVRARIGRRPRRRVAPLVGASLLLAASLAFLLVRLFPSTPAPLSAGLDAPVAWATLQPTPEVQLDFQGSGTLGGTARSLALQWELGTLKVEVEPNRGIDLAVHTREAEVRVVGTGFSVTRDALGTAVSVSHGHVAVMCADGQNALLGPGETRVCVPTSPSGLLGRAHGLVEAGAALSEVLAAADAGLAAGATGAVQGELSLLRVETLGRLGRNTEALAAAEAALAAAPARPLDLHHLAAHDALASTGCAAALPHLVALGADATGPELVQYADCIAPTDAVAARAALTAALRDAPPPDQEAGIVERLTRLTGVGGR
jgi:ferric-dicitrate binding protein FerR (iron transport regulator)